MRTCLKCGAELTSENQFPSHFRRNTCKKCELDYNRKYNPRHNVLTAVSRAKVRHETFVQYSASQPPQCICCGEFREMALTLDHVNNDGGKHRREIGIDGGIQFYMYLKRKGWPMVPPLQVMCYNCQGMKQLNGGVCPHMLEKREKLEWQ